MNSKALQIGQKYHRLTIISYDPLSRRWEALCDCGNTTYIKKTWGLKSGKVKGCGCMAVGLRPQAWLPNDLGLVRELMKGYRASAKRRGHEFTLTEEEFHKLIQQNCFFCNAEPRDRNLGRLIE